EEGQDGREVWSGADKAHVPELRNRKPCALFHRIRTQGVLLGVRQELRLHRTHALSAQEYGMGRAPKKDKSKKGSRIFEDEASSVEGEAEDGDLPKDEAGRRKIKRQYEDLLGIRVEKLKGRILNRERINKTIEGVYFICAECKKVCHNMDEGLVEDPDNVHNLCASCTKSKVKGKQAAA